MLAEAWPATVRLVGISLLLSYLLDRHRRDAGGPWRPARHRALRCHVTLFALPGYWLGLMLVMLFTYKLRCSPRSARPDSTPTS